MADPVPPKTGTGYVASKPLAPSPIPPTWGSGYIAAQSPTRVASAQTYAATAAAKARAQATATALAQQAKMAAIAQQVAAAAKAAQLASAIKSSLGSQDTNRPSYPTNNPPSYSGAALAPPPVSLNPNAQGAPVTATAAPAVGPAIQAASSTGAPSAVGTFTNATGAGGTYGQLQRMRQNRGPQTGLSITPEMLKAIARSRIGRT